MLNQSAQVILSNVSVLVHMRCNLPRDQERLGEETTELQSGCNTCDEPDDVACDDFIAYASGSESNCIDRNERSLGLQAALLHPTGRRLLGRGFAHHDPRVAAVCIRLCEALLRSWPNDTHGHDADEEHSSCSPTKRRRQERPHPQVWLILKSAMSCGLRSGANEAHWALARHAALKLAQAALGAAVASSSESKLRLLMLDEESRDGDELSCAVSAVLRAATPSIVLICLQDCAEFVAEAAREFLCCALTSQQVPVLRDSLCAAVQPWLLEPLKLIQQSCVASRQMPLSAEDQALRQAPGRTSSQLPCKDSSCMPCPPPVSAEAFATADAYIASGGHDGGDAIASLWQLGVADGEMDERLGALEPVASLLSALVERVAHQARAAQIERTEEGATGSLNGINDKDAFDRGRCTPALLELLRHENVLCSYLRLLPLALRHTSPPRLRELLLGMVSTLCEMDGWVVSKLGLATLHTSSEGLALLDGKGLLYSARATLRQRCVRTLGAAHSDPGMELSSLHAQREQLSTPKIDEPSGMFRNSLPDQFAAIALATLCFEEDAGQEVGALRLLGACRPSSETTSCAEGGLPAPVQLVVSLFKTCFFGGEIGDAEVCRHAFRGERGLTMIHALQAAMRWISTSWAAALLAASWDELMLHLLEAVCPRRDRAGVLCGDESASHGADSLFLPSSMNERLVRSVCSTLAALLTKHELLHNQDQPACRLLERVEQACRELARIVIRLGRRHNSSQHRGTLSADVDPRSSYLEGAKLHVYASSYDAVLHEAALDALCTLVLAYPRLVFCQERVIRPCAVTASDLGTVSTVDSFASALKESTAVATRSVKLCAAKCFVALLSLPSDMVAVCTSDHVAWNVVTEGSTRTATAKPPKCYAAEDHAALIDAAANTVFVHDVQLIRSIDALLRDVDLTVRMTAVEAVRVLNATPEGWTSWTLCRPHWPSELLQAITEAEGDDDGSIALMLSATQLIRLPHTRGALRGALCSLPSAGNGQQVASSSCSRIPLAYCEMAGQWPDTPPSCSLAEVLSSHSCFSRFDVAIMALELASSILMVLTDSLEEGKSASALLNLGAAACLDAGKRHCDARVRIKAADLLEHLGPLIEDVVLNSPKERSDVLRVLSDGVARVDDEQVSFFGPKQFRHECE